MTNNSDLNWLRGARVPGIKTLVDIGCDAQQIRAIEPHQSEVSHNPSSALVTGDLVTGPLAAWHTHLDKTFTIARAQQKEPGLLGAITACIDDHKNWTAEDLFERGNRALEQSWAAGCTVVRTHIDWVVESEPLAWRVFNELAIRWHGRIELQRVALLRSEFFETPEASQKIVESIKQSNGWLGAFVHSSNASQTRMNHLIRCALDNNLKIDLHLDEEINPDAQGLDFLLNALKRFNALDDHPQIAASHLCSLSAMPQGKMAALIEGLAQAQIEVIALPATNLYLQDQTNPAQPLTPRHRGIAPVHELKRAGVQVRLSCDNVQDPFYPWGNYDPLSLMQLAAPALQLVNCFDEWANAITAHPVAVGQPANLTVIEGTNAAAWPAVTSPRKAIRAGKPVDLSTFSS